MSKYSEADLVRELGRSWLSKSDRKWMERELAKIRASGAPAIEQPKHAPTARHTAAPRGEEATIVIDGSPAFIAATEKALKALQGTPSWALVSGLRGIRQATNDQMGKEEVGGYLNNGTFHVSDRLWRASVTQYASAIAHEGAHAIDRHSETLTDREKFAFAAQARALRELGASKSEIDEIEAHARNPTHHIGWVAPKAA